MQHGAQIAQRPEDFRAGHQNDQQRLEAHLAVANPVGTQRECRSGTKGTAQVGDAPGQNAGAETRKVLSDRARALSARIRPKAPLWPKAFSVGSPCIASRNSSPNALKARYARAMRGRSAYGRPSAPSE